MQLVLAGCESRDGAPWDPLSGTTPPNPRPLPLPPNTQRLENTLNYGMERVWALGTVKGSNNVAFGFDEVTSAVA